MITQVITNYNLVKQLIDTGQTKSPILCMRSNVTIDAIDTESMSDTSYSFLIFKISITCCKAEAYSKAYEYLLNNIESSPDMSYSDRVNAYINHLIDESGIYQFLDNLYAKIAKEKLLKPFVIQPYKVELNRESPIYKEIEELFDH